MSSMLKVYLKRSCDTYSEWLAGPILIEDMLYNYPDVTSQHEGTIHQNMFQDMLKQIV
jgi:hypothetical protein